MISKHMLRVLGDNILVSNTSMHHLIFLFRKSVDFIKAQAKEEQLFLFSS